MTESGNNLHLGILDDMEHEAKYATDTEWRKAELRIQALGAAISRRDWHAVEQAHAAIRDAAHCANTRPPDTAMREALAKIAKAPIFKVQVVLGTFDELVGAEVVKIATGALASAASPPILRTYEEFIANPDEPRFPEVDDKAAALAQAELDALEEHPILHPRYRRKELPPVASAQVTEKDTALINAGARISDLEIALEEVRYLAEGQAEAFLCWGTEERAELTRQTIIAIINNALASAPPPEQAGDDEQDEPGKVIWHCSEEDGLPDVGLELRLGNGARLWAGEISSDRWRQDSKATIVGIDSGWWLVLYEKDETTIIGKLTGREAADKLIEEILSPLLRNRRAVPEQASDGWVNVTPSAPLPDDLKVGDEIEVLGARLPITSVEQINGRMVYGADDDTWRNSVTAYRRTGEA